MSYMHIENLYRPKGQRVLLFKRAHIMEKVHGTSARIYWKAGQVHISHLQFMNGSPSSEELKAAFQKMGHDHVTVYGEAYGGKMQRMSQTYGLEKRFIAFEVQLGGLWLTVPQAADVCQQLGLEFVPWLEVDCDLSVLDHHRDLSSEVAMRRGTGSDKVREGIVIRPTMELTANGERIIAKHKGAAFSEIDTPREVVDPAKLKVLEDAESIAMEWVTDNRLENVILQVKGYAEVDLSIVHTKPMIEFMIRDIVREASGEIVDSKEARTAIGARTAKMFKAWLKTNE